MIWIVLDHISQPHRKKDRSEPLGQREEQVQGKDSASSGSMAMAQIQLSC